MNFLKLMIIAILFLFSASLTAQLTSGSIKMAITDMEISGMEDNADMRAIFESMKMTIHFKPGEQVIETSLMGMMNTKQYFKDNMMTQYIDMMGQKMVSSAPVGVQSLEDVGVSADDIEGMFDIVYDKKSTKEILGYPCYKATVIMDMTKIDTDQKLPKDMKTMTIILYINEEIEMKHMNFQQFNGIELPGAPLSMAMDAGLMKMTYEAIEINEIVDSKVFEKPEGDYREMTEEELKTMGIGKAFGF